MGGQDQEVRPGFELGQDDQAGIGDQTEDGALARGGEHGQRWAGPRRRRGAQGALDRRAIEEVTDPALVKLRDRPGLAVGRGDAGAELHRERCGQLVGASEPRAQIVRLAPQALGLGPSRLEPDQGVIPLGQDRLQVGPRPLELDLQFGDLRPFGFKGLARGRL